MKKVLSKVLVIFMAMSLCACGGSSAPASTSPASAETAAPAETSAQAETEEVKTEAEAVAPAEFALSVFGKELNFDMTCDEVEEIFKENGWTYSAVPMKNIEMMQDESGDKYAGIIHTRDSEPMFIGLQITDNDIVDLGNNIQIGSTEDEVTSVYGTEAEENEENGYLTRKYTFDEGSIAFGFKDGVVTSITVRGISTEQKAVEEERANASDNRKVTVDGVEYCIPLKGAELLARGFETSWTELDNGSTAFSKSGKNGLLGIQISNPNNEKLPIPEINITGLSGFYDPGAEIEMSFRGLKLGENCLEEAREVLTDFEYDESGTPFFSYNEDNMNCMLEFSKDGVLNTLIVQMW